MNKCPRRRPLGSGKTGRINKGFRDRETEAGVLRRCNGPCDAELPLTAFPVRSADPRGRRSTCKACWRPIAAAKARQCRAERKAAQGRLAALRKTAA